MTYPDVLTPPRGLDDRTVITTEPLPNPCWWIDRHDPWEITHHRTPEDATANHRDRVCSDHGWVLTVAGAFAIVPGDLEQEHQRCCEVICPDCGEGLHLQERYEECWECGHGFVITAFPDPDLPGQGFLLEVLPTHDIPGNPLVIVMGPIEGDLG